MKPANQDHAFITRFLETPHTPLRVLSNPMAIALGTHIVAADPQQGRLELEFTPSETFVQGTGVLQGGAVAGMLDFAMAFSVLARLGDTGTCATVDLTTAFLRAAPAGRYRAIGEIVRSGKSIAFCRAELWKHDDARGPVATAMATFVASSS
ncbi:PaaI family thioesterase [Paraburkholderia sp. J7]|uniref:PaaI family thioesterase n=1 Tax=Paraburkholderia sp. J7 TaxID=2805438 RepID=UPI002AB720B8|nr:PaaI family thioesterase [Paraburkholderia sp. J7]